MNWVVATDYVNNFILHLLDGLRTWHKLHHLHVAALGLPTATNSATLCLLAGSLRWCTCRSSLEFELLERAELIGSHRWVDHVRLILSWLDAAMLWNLRFFVDVSVLVVAQLHHLSCHLLVIVQRQEFVGGILLVQVRLDAFTRFASWSKQPSDTVQIFGAATWVRRILLVLIHQGCLIKFVIKVV